jgi:hypothetical protein
MEALSLLNNIPVNKQAVEDIIKAATDDILSGRQNPIDIAIKLKAMEDIIKAIRANQDVKDFTLDTAEQSGSKSFDFNGARITIAEVSKYDYSADKHWSELENTIKIARDRQKIHEKLLQDLDREMADPETGELIIPATKVSDKQLRILLK